MILGVVPARGSSKGIPRKNIKPLAGKPLITWTLEAAQRSRLLDRFVVSTEDAEITRICRSWGAEVLPRPPELATDEASTLSVLQHVLQAIPAQTVVLLQPTSPVRDPDLIDRCIDRFLKAKADSLATGFICKAQEYAEEAQRRQDVKGFFTDDGNIYVIRADLLQRRDRHGQRVERMLLDREQNLDIDDAFDFWVAEQILLKRAAK